VQMCITSGANVKYSMSKCTKQQQMCI